MTIQDRRAIWTALFHEHSNNINPAIIDENFCYELFGRGYLDDITDYPNHYDIKLKYWEPTFYFGDIDDITFFKLLSQRKLPINTRLRNNSEMKEPIQDYFHDVFGLIPTVDNEEISRFLNKIGIIYTDNLKINPSASYFIKKVHDLIIHNGLLIENGTRKGFGTLFKTNSKRLNLIESFNVIDILSLDEEVPNWESDSILLDSIDELKEIF